jgi:hypothetical protein
MVQLGLTELLLLKFELNQAELIRKNLTRTIVGHAYVSLTLTT